MAWAGGWMNILGVGGKSDFRDDCTVCLAEICNVQQSIRSANSDQTYE